MGPHVEVLRQKGESEGRKESVKPESGGRVSSGRGSEGEKLRVKEKGFGAAVWLKPWYMMNQFSGKKKKKSPDW